MMLHCCEHEQYAYMLAMHENESFTQTLCVTQLTHQTPRSRFYPSFLSLLSSLRQEEVPCRQRSRRKQVSVTTRSFSSGRNPSICRI